MPTGMRLLGDVVVGREGVLIDVVEVVEPVNAAHAPATLSPKKVWKAMVW